MYKQTIVSDPVIGCNLYWRS